MTLRELLQHRMQASSGNVATFHVAAIGAQMVGPSHMVIATRWEFRPTVADIAEAHALLKTVADFRPLESTRSAAEANQFVAGRRVNPANN